MTPHTQIPHRFLAACIVCRALLAPASQAAEVTHETAPETGIESWTLRDQGASLLLMQITPDQATAFFLGRGFDRSAADHYASSCVFMTVVRNESASGSISYRLADWRYTAADGRQRAIKPADEWLREWKRRKLPQTSLIAFEWSQHPYAQTLEVGDWNQGMTTYALPLGSRFDLKFRWAANGKMHDAMLEGVRCAQPARDN